MQKADLEWVHGNEAIFYPFGSSPTSNVRFTGSIEFIRSHCSRFSGDKPRVARLIRHPRRNVDMTRRLGSQCP
jgi:hypothetical protein